MFRKVNVYRNGGLQKKELEFHLVSFKVQPNMEDKYTIQFNGIAERDTNYLLKLQKALITRYYTASIN